MFNSLSDKLGNVFDKLRGKGTLSENDVMTVSREIRIALLEADVALPVVKNFISAIKGKAIGENVIKGINPGQQIIKIVHDALIEMLGSSADELQFSTPPCAYLMLGLQGSGKTTSTAKIAKLLTKKHKKKVLMASLDIYRPAAQEQLKQLGEQTGIATLEIIKDQKPVDIAKRAMKTASKEGYDVVMLDTAGRLSIDEKLMAEAKSIKDVTNPVETLLIADAMTGQDAVQTATAFDAQVGITGIMLTRVDGDSRGGAAMSMKAVTGKPIKLIGVGENWSEIETFHPERIAGRILGMGDVVSLVEKAVESVDAAEAEKMAAKFKKGKFDFNDLLSQMRQMQKMGGMGTMLKMLPGMGKIAGALDEAGVDDSMIKKQEAIILSMTIAEREKPELLNMRRKQRIASGSGTSVQEINKLAKQLKQMQGMMKKMRKMGTRKMMGMMKEMMGGNTDDLELMAQSMDPDGLGADISAIQGAENSSNSILGANPFTAGGAMSSGGVPSGDLAELLGNSSQHVSGKKKNRKKNKR